MKCLVWRAVFIALLLPIFAVAAESAGSEYASVLKAKPDPVHGAQLFGQCISCHGADGGGDVNGSSPRIAGQHYRVIAKQIVDFRYGKRWDFRMEGMADRHHITGVQDIADVAAYVSKLAQPGKRGIGSGEFVAEGSRIFAQQCQSCHGKGAEGNASAVCRGSPANTTAISCGRCSTRSTAGVPHYRHCIRSASNLSTTNRCAPWRISWRESAGRKASPQHPEGLNSGGVMRVRSTGQRLAAQA